MTHALPDGNPWELAQICREALNREIYGGDAPHDSNALTEIWPTSTGAGFEIPLGDGQYAIIIAPVDAVKDLIQPDYSAWPVPQPRK